MVPLDVLEAHVRGPLGAELVVVDQQFGDTLLPDVEVDLVVEAIPPEYRQFLGRADADLPALDGGVLDDDLAGVRFVPVDTAAGAAPDEVGVSDPNVATVPEEDALVAAVVVVPRRSDEVPVVVLERAELVGGEAVDGPVVGVPLVFPPELVAGEREAAAGGEGRVVLEGDQRQVARGRQPVDDLVGRLQAVRPSTNSTG
ncbi:hypothetical protein ACFQH8_00355 [Halomicroarcula sp. GCM10025710]